MFLYGMRMMGDGLKASSSGTLKKAMERITGTPLKAFLCISLWELLSVLM
jgi:phosphate:Na+ symporter